MSLRLARYNEAKPWRLDRHGATFSSEGELNLLSEMRNFAALGLLRIVRRGIDQFSKVEIAMPAFPRQKGDPAEPLDRLDPYRKIGVG